MRFFILFLIIITSFYSTFAQPDYKTWDTFLKKYVSATGDVDYKSIKANKKSLDSIVTVSYTHLSTDSIWSAGI